MSLAAARRRLVLSASPAQVKKGELSRSTCDSALISQYGSALVRLAYPFGAGDPTKNIVHKQNPNSDGAMRLIHCYNAYHQQQ